MATILSVIALVVSALAIAVSTALGVRQQKISRHSNYVPVMSNLMAEFRSPNFHENHSLVMALRAPDQPVSGFSDLPPDARAAFVDVVYFYQMVAMQISMGVLDEKTMLAQLHSRIISVWEVVEPYVQAERENNPYGNKNLLSVLEYYAQRARDMSPADLQAALLPNRR